MGNILEDKEKVKILKDQNFKNRCKDIQLKPKTVPGFTHAKSHFHYVKPLVIDNQSIFCQSLMRFQQSNNGLRQLRQLASRSEQICNRHRVNTEKNKISVFWNSFIKIRNRNFLQYYQVVNPLGKGGFGTVFKIRNKKEPKIQRAAKIIKKDKLASHHSIQKLYTEVDISMKLDHPNIVKLYEVFQSEEEIVLIQQICSGGDLQRRVKDINSFTQNQAAEIMRQVLSAVVYMHKLRVVHCDIKPQNILYNEKNNLFKIADFGTAVVIKPDQKLKKKVGSPFYIAPQVLARKYDQKCDVWSCGIMLYVLLTGFFPFYGETKDQIFRKIQNLQLPLKGMIWQNRSKDVKKLLFKMLQKDPKRRISALQALNSVWIKNNSNQAKKPKLIENQVLQNLRSFSFKNSLQAVVYTYIASQLYQNEQNKRIFEAFQKIDTDQDGIIQIDQLMNIFKSSKIKDQISDKQLQQIFNRIDFNGSGQIDFTQFLVATSKQKSFLNIQRLQSAFDYFDTDRSGYLSADKFRQFFSNKNEQHNQIDKIFDQVGENGNGLISKQQFLQLFLAKKKRC